jgi:archaellum biogenesis ATPase FlaH
VRGAFTLGLEQVSGKSMRILKVNKINTTKSSVNNSVAFIVARETGARLIPFNKT